MSAYYSVQQVARFLDVCDRKVHDLIRSGKLNAVNINPGGHRPRWRIRQCDIDNVVEAAQRNRSRTRRVKVERVI